MRNRGIDAQRPIGQHTGQQQFILLTVRQLISWRCSIIPFEQFRIVNIQLQTTSGNNDVTQHLTHNWSVMSSSKTPIVSLSKKVYPYCLVLDAVPGTDLNGFS